LQEKHQSARAKTYEEQYPGKPVERRDKTGDNTDSGNDGADPDEHWGPAYVAKGCFSQHHGLQGENNKEKAVKTVRVIRYQAPASDEDKKSRYDKSHAANEEDHYFQGNFDLFQRYAPDSYFSSFITEKIQILSC